MHRMFSDWYSSVDIQPRPETIGLHWNAAVKVANESDTLQAIELVAFYLGLPASGDARSRLQNASKDEDVTFPMKDNDALLSVISAGALSYIMTLDSPVADAAALSLVCGNLGSKGASGPIEEVFIEADDIIYKRSRSARSIGSDQDQSDMQWIRFVSGPKGVANLPESPADSSIQGIWQTLRDRDISNRSAIDKIVSDLNKTIDKLKVRLDNIERGEGSKLFRTLDEETSILWWLFAGYSDDFEKPLMGIDKNTRALVVGKEVATKVRFELGHPAARAILDRALGPLDENDGEHADLGELTTLLKVTRSAPHDWAAAWVPVIPNVPLGLIPIHAAIAFGHQFSEDEQAAQFVQKTGLDLDIALTPLEIAYQAHNETLLLRLI